MMSASDEQNGHGGPADHIRGRISIAAALAFLVGVAWRIYYIEFLHPADKYIYSDMNSYVASAIHFFDPTYKLVVGDSLYPPGMAYFLGLLHLVDPSWKLAIHVQCVISLAIPILMALIARTLFGHRAAAVTLIFGSLYFPFIDYAGYFLSENPFILIFLEATLIFLQALRARSVAGRLGWGLLAGVTTGVGATFRSVILAPAFLLACYLALVAWKNKRRDLLVLLPAALAGTLAVLVPTSVRCTRVNEGRFCVVSTNGSLNFLMGHHGHAGHFKFDDKKRGYYYEFGDPTKLYKRYEEELRVPHGPYDSEELSQIAWNWIQANPVDALLNSIEHVSELFFGAVPWPTSHTAQRRWQLLYQELFLFLIMIPALFRLHRHGKSMVRLETAGIADTILWLPLLGVMISVFLTIGEARYRIPCDGFLIILAAAFLAQATPRVLVKDCPAAHTVLGGGTRDPVHATGHHGVEAGTGGRRLDNQWILGVITLVSGGTLLALEILASRVLAPHFGSSTYVWGSLISTFLASLALGYELGGRAADRWPRHSVLHGVVLLSGLCVLPIPVLAEPVQRTVIASGVGPRAGPLLAAGMLFIVPGVLMGMVSPFAVRLRTQSISSVGATAGGLYALSTVGSIVGALITAFFLIDSAGVRLALAGIAGVQMAVAILAVGITGRRTHATILALVAALLAVGLGLGRDRTTDVFMKDSAYQRVAVRDVQGARYLYLDSYWQTAVHPSDPTRAIFEYTDYMHLPMLATPDARRVLVLGLGGGLIPRRYFEEYPEVTVDVVELDPAVIDTAAAFFSLPRSERFRTVVDDGRRFLQSNSTQYDVILLDAYVKNHLPFHLATQEFFRVVRSRLRPGGTVAVNVIGSIEGPQSALFRAIYKTTRSVFPSVQIFAAERDRYAALELERNIILLLRDDPPPVRAELIRSAKDLEPRVRLISTAVDNEFTESINTADVPVLTDNHAPTEALQRM